MTPEERYQADLLAPWLAKATLLVQRRIKGARSHAESELMADANDSLTELEDGLKELIEAAQAEFYLRAFPAQWAILDPAIVDPDIGPNESGRDAAKVAPIQGMDLPAMLAKAVEQSRRELMLAAGSTVDRPLTRPVAYKNWALKHTDAITLAATMALGNAQVALYHAVGAILIKKDLR